MITIIAITQPILVWLCNKETIAWAVAVDGRSQAEYGGEIPNRRKNIVKLVERLNKQFEGEVLLWCYEAGPCGHTLHRQLLELGQDCQVIAPSKIPKEPGEPAKVVEGILAIRGSIIVRLKLTRKRVKKRGGSQAFSVRSFSIISLNSIRYPILENS